MALLLSVLLATLLCCIPARGAEADSVRITTDADTTGRKSDIDTIVTFSARDSVHFHVGSRRMRLRGKADVNFKVQRLQSEVILMDFGGSTLTADGARDTTGRLYGFPIFTDNGEEYAGERIAYNFSTKLGRVTQGETNVEGGYYWGSKIKRVGERTMYVEDGSFTTCDNPQPHFHFNSPKMKVVVDDKIFLDPVVLYVEDIPIFILPLGLYFSTEHGRRSGIIVPTPLFAPDRGIVLQGLGYYWAASDLWDTELSADVTSKGGYTLYNRTQWNVRDHYSGRAELRYGKTRFNVDDDFSENIGATLYHQQTFRPNETVSLDLMFTTTKLYQNTSFNQNDRIRQNARSNASYQRTFYNGHTFNAVYTRDQNMVNGSTTQTPSISYSIPTFFPLRDAFVGDSWVKDMQLSYRAVGRYNHNAQRISDTLPFTVTENSWIEHRPSLSVTPKLGVFNLQPTISYSENWHFQRYNSTVNTIDSTVVSGREQGFFREYTYSAGVSASTFLYGMANINALGITAFRHTMQPTIGFSYSPDQSDTSLGFFQEYISPYTGDTILVSRFNEGRIASSQRQMNISMGLLNRFEVKGSPIDDTTDARPIEILTVNLNSSYNLAADSLRLAPITVGIRTPVLDAVSFNTNLTFDAYDQVRSVDPFTGQPSWRRINRTLLESGGGIARLTNFTLNMGTQFSSQGVSFENRSNTSDTAHADTTQRDLRSRVDSRLNATTTTSDIYGDASPGWSNVVIPWNVSLDLTYNYSRSNPDLSNQTLYLTIRGGFSLTPTLDVNATGTFDFVTGRLNNPVIDVNKRIHCWNLSLNWVPAGPNTGFFLRFSADAAMLKDLMITKQNTPLYR